MKKITLDLSLDPKAGYEVLNYIHPHPAGDGAYYMADMNGVNISFGYVG